VDLGQVTLYSSGWCRAGAPHHGTTEFTTTLTNFFRTPVILAILGGILANRAGLVPWLEAQPLSSSLVVTLEIIAGLTMPLVAIVIGYEMRLQRGRLLQPALTVAIRLACWIPLGVLIGVWIIGQLLALISSRLPVDAVHLTALVIPCLSQASEEQRGFVVNTLPGDIGCTARLLSSAAHTRPDLFA
jgi:hypothetical protein